MKSSVQLFCCGLILASLSVNAQPEHQSTLVEFENALAEKLFEESFEITLTRNPEFQTRLGQYDNNHLWRNRSKAYEDETFRLTQAHWNKTKKSLTPDLLNKKNLISYRLMEHNRELDRKGRQYRYHSYPLNQMFGIHAHIPAFLINHHPARQVQDLEDYISRLNAIPQLIAERISFVTEQEEKGILPPAFVFPYLISDCSNILNGRPFTDTALDSPLFEDFKSKVHSLKLKRSEEERLLSKGREALLQSVKPAYQKLLNHLESAHKRADSRDGAWKLPKGEDYYNYRLQLMTTTELTAEEIHQLGLQEMNRLHQEMRSIMKRVNYGGGLKEFFTFVKTDPRFFLSNDEQGKQEYLNRATDYIVGMSKKLDQIFITQPSIDLIVKAVEPFREKSAPKAFYTYPSPDGERPGIFYANLSNMNDMPVYEVEALVYHEGIPGHHMQWSISYTLENIPRFRRFGGYTAHSEGWGLYAETLAKEYGFYADPYSDFGRLTMELWRAARLVVDTGIHYRKWDREEAIQYLLENTPNPEGYVISEVERYIVMPGQATAYKIGQLKILELRENAKNILGERFDIRAFHELLLLNGTLPLWLLEEEVERWIVEQPNH